MDRQTAHQSAHAAYIPALRFHWLTPLYDLVLQWAFPEARLRRFMVEQIGAPARLLDLGCGTGTLVRLVRSAAPAVSITALDIDSAVLAIAQRKAQAGGSIDFVQGSATAPPLIDGAFDCVVTSLVLHHLPPAGKAAALDACRRLLRPGGLLLVADFAAPRTRYARAVSGLVSHLEEVADNLRGGLPTLIAAAGFTDVRALAHFDSIMGTLTVYQAHRP